MNSPLAQNYWKGVVHETATKFKDTQTQILFIRINTYQSIIYIFYNNTEYKFETHTCAVEVEELVVLTEVGWRAHPFHLHLHFKFLSCSYLIIGEDGDKKNLNKVGIGDRCDSGKIGMGSPYICGFLNEKKNTKGHIIYISFKVRKTISFTMLIVVSASMRSRDLPLSL